MKHFLLIAALWVAAGGASARECLKFEGTALWSPPVYQGECLLVIADRGPGKAFHFTYHESLKWESWGMFQKGTDGTLRRVQVFKLQVGTGIATKDEGWRSSFDQIFDYFPLRRNPWTKWRDGKLWQTITVRTNYDGGYLVILEERIFE